MRSQDFLIQKGADVDSVAPNQFTALMFAAKHGHLETVKLLLKADADTDIQTPNGDTALKLAKEAGHGQVVDLLKEAGAEESEK